MDMSVVGSVMSHQAKVSTLEKVNTHLLKSNNEQLEQQAAQLLESVAPVTNEDGKGTSIDVHV
tara:strand:- start:103 stop:291 length:189 start_codon:yes stop_codon:yes gene_type:complete